MCRVLYASVVVLAVVNVLPSLSLIALLTIPLAHWAVKSGQPKVDTSYELLPVNFATIGLHLFVGILLTVGVALDTMMAG